MNDYLDDEEKLMDERCHEEIETISFEIFQKPISELRPSAAISLNENTKIYDVIKKMQNSKIGSVLLERDQILTGIFTERDILNKIVGKIEDYNDKAVLEFMTPTPICLRMDDPIKYVLHNMHLGGYRHIPIVDESLRPIAIVSVKDITNYLLNYFPKEVDNITDEPFRGVSLREGA